MRDITCKSCGLALVHQGSQQQPYFFFHLQHQYSACGHSTTHCASPPSVSSILPLLSRLLLFYFIFLVPRAIRGSPDRVLSSRKLFVFFFFAPLLRLQHSPYGAISSLPDTAVLLHPYYSILLHLSSRQLPPLPTLFFKSCTVNPSSYSARYNSTRLNPLS